MKALNSIEGNPLNSSERLLAAYESLLARSTRMLACVREHDWFELVEEQSCYVVEVEFIAKAEGAIDLNEAEKEHKAELLEKILRQDLEIRQRLFKRKEELQKQMSVAQCKRDLARSYGVPLGLDQGAP
ncbi:flagellar protein FliT [Microbulbifer thermotolerans]|uniref:flagellar protein FliT n=1 Tax=Microbulbifer thermotolerans TaxID=252514 RepID=UPI0022498E80|nr:flagellar protein FliT [Microbulbifer thermotolerans]MCX2780133.1 flagellar protein FliT [Microbulbifer thermotolerans]MCX2805557.1 flagellar protein FliT [Microbulbifer thermotolerans]MCX2831915.1 flagellar protein FliT [Microbulbifer thermotolerans]MCX2842520.1 flagellar protein FliT [Microbulbifer thermotolerans]